MIERKTWYRDDSGMLVCVLCAQRYIRGRLEHQRDSVRFFQTGRAEELREHLRHHRDKPKWLHGDFLPATDAPYDVHDPDELAELEALAICEMSYDPQCEELAAAFLHDYPGNAAYDRARLARHIQEAVESWIASEIERAEAS